MLYRKMKYLLEQETTEKNPLDIIHAEASDPLTPTARLSELAGHENPYIKVAVAKNPNTHPKDLATLGLQHGLIDQVKENPSIELHSLEHPDIINGAKNKHDLMLNTLLHHGGGATYGTISKITHPTTLEALADHSDPNFRYYTANNNHLPLPKLETMVNDPDDGVRGLVAADSRIDKNSHLTLMNDPSSIVRRGLTRNRYLHPHAIEKLSKDTDQNVLQALLRNRPALPDDIIQNIFNSSDAETKLELAKKDHFVSAEMFNKLADEPDQNIKSAVAGNSGAPQKVLHKLATAALQNPGNNQFVLKKLALNKNTEPAIIDQILNIKGLDIDEYVADNRHATSEHLAQIAHRNPLSDDNEFFWQTILQHPNTSAEILHKYHDIMPDYMQELILQHDNTALPTYKSLATNKNTTQEIRNMAKKLFKKHQYNDEKMFI